MGSIIGLLVLLMATLTLGGCAGLPLGALGALANGGAYGGGYGGSCAQPYGAAGGIPVPVPLDPGYAGGYGPQGQPYYGPQPYAYNNNGIINGVGGYQPGYGPDQPYQQWSSAEVQQRLQHQQDRIQQALNSGQLTADQAQRLQAEQTNIQQAMTRMQSDGRLSPWETARLNQMLNRSGHDIYGTTHNGTTTQPGTDTQPGTNTAGQHWNGFNHNGATAQPGTNTAGQPGSGTTNNGPMAAQSGRGHMGPNGYMQPNGPGGQPVGPMAQYRRGPMGQPGMAGPANIGGARFQPRPMAQRVQPVQGRPQAAQQRRVPGI